MTKYFYLRLNVIDGNNEHSHHIVSETKCKNVRFAALRYAASYYPGEEVEFEDYDLIFNDLSIVVQIEKIEELEHSEYKRLHHLMYHF